MGKVRGQGAVQKEQVEFLRRLEKGEKTPEEVREEMGISVRQWRQWVGNENFKKRYHAALDAIDEGTKGIEKVAAKWRARRELDAARAGGVFVVAGAGAGAGATREGVKGGEEVKEEEEAGEGMEFADPEALVRLARLKGELPAEEAAKEG